LTVQPELQEDQFLEYFKLSSNKTEVKPVDAKTNVSDNSIVKKTSQRVRGSVSFARCATIPFSSPAGLVLAKKSKAMTEDIQQERLDRIERHVIAPALNDSNRPKWLDAETDCVRWLVTYKPNRDKVTTNDYAHQYKFVNSVRSKPSTYILYIYKYVFYVYFHVFLNMLFKRRINVFVSMYTYLNMLILL